MKLLITGLSGFVGTYVGVAASNQFEIFGTYNNNLPSIKNLSGSMKVDLTDKKTVFNCIEKIKPDIVIHAAGTKNVNYCETHPEYAFESHVVSTRNLVDALHGSSAPLIYISTDCVFDGIKEFYSENDETSPVNQYGKVKLIAEEYIKQNTSNYLVVRISLMFGWTVGEQLSNTVQDVILNLRKNNTITLSQTSYNTPLYARDACQIIIELVKNNTYNGVVHLAGNTRLSRYELGITTAKMFSFDEKLIIPTTENLPNRPVNSCLSMNYIPQKLGLLPCELLDGLASMKRDENIAFHGDAYAKDIS